MKRILIFAVAALAAAAITPAALAETPPPVVPFPATHTGDVFVAAQTVAIGGAMSNYFAPGTTVVFRAYAVDGKSYKLLMKNAVRRFYVSIPHQPNVKLSYTPKSKAASGRYAWTGRWKVPADYALGIVNFRVIVKSVEKRIGAFKQIPVAPSQLTITTTPQLPPGPGPGGSPPPNGNPKFSVALYADTVNGTRPKGAPPRPIGCTQTNVFKRGEQLVVRTWGFDLKTGAVMTMDNVQDAHISIPGVAKTLLNWGAHGPTGAKVWFWSVAWNIPTDYPLGDVSIQIRFTTLAGKVGKVRYPITIIPN